LARKTYSVVPVGGRWELRFENLPLYEGDDKDTVIANGQINARADKPSELLVHRSDGSVAYQYTYGVDAETPNTG
jgi:hypothetical protein